jgi:transposase InsO family protein
MPWKESSAMSLRQEFVTLAAAPDANVRALCRRFGISPKTAYKWVARFEAGNGSPDALADRPRRPRRSPGKTSDELERGICGLRRQHPAWGGRKIHARLLALGHAEVPAPSTVTDILRRHELLCDAAESLKHRPFVRFEHEHPNDLWQMDFMGHFATDRGGRCHTLTVLDDCSRFALDVRACADETTATVRTHLTGLFRRYGLPRRVLSDNGSPWGCDAEHRYTMLSAWLIRLGVGVSHGRPLHPQTQGKDERLHRTIRAEAIGSRRFVDLADVQRRGYDPWRDVYNLQRPHEALGMRTPASRYAPSPREFPEHLPPIEYAPGDTVRSVGRDGYFNYGRLRHKVSQAFAGQRVALRPTATDGQMEVFFCHQRIATVNLTRGISP